MDSVSENYYFSGGYSNRDYIGLCEKWRQYSGRKLVIIASSNNSDLVEYINSKGLPSNISIYYDTDAHEFDRVLFGAEACILPMKYDFRAAGQSVMLRAMRLHKLIIASDTKIIREYVNDKESGFLYKTADELDKILDVIEEDRELKMAMIEKSDFMYRTRFSFDKITKSLLEVLNMQETENVH